MKVLDDNNNGLKNYSAVIVLQLFKNLQVEKLVTVKQKPDCNRYCQRRKNERTKARATNSRTKWW